MANALDLPIIKDVTLFGPFERELSAVWRMNSLAASKFRSFSGSFGPNENLQQLVRCPITETTRSGLGIQSASDEFSLTVLAEFFASENWAKSLSRNRSPIALWIGDHSRFINEHECVTRRMVGMQLCSHNRSSVTERLQNAQKIPENDADVRLSHRRL